ncbi:MAG: hypothetical protein CL912_27850 [Deltaproteobacteria bacterium]|nr:hypothetical protein [Deltaproteobacteria bacterium]
MSSNWLADRSAPSGLCEICSDVEVVFDVGPRKLAADSAAWMRGGAFKSQTRSDDIRGNIPDHTVCEAASLSSFGANCLGASLHVRVIRDRGVPLNLYLVAMEVHNSSFVLVFGEQCSDCHPF